MGTPPDGYAATSTVLGVLRQLRVWVTASWIVSHGTALTTTLATAAHASGLAAGVRTLAHWTRYSYGYHWLTTEPEPEVIVIDLRETYTVGPLIAGLDRVAPLLARTWRGSRAARPIAWLRTAPNWTALTDSRTAHLLKAALAPPDPPEDARDAPAAGTDDEDGSSRRPDECER